MTQYQISMVEVSEDVQTVSAEVNGHAVRVLVYRDVDENVDVERTRLRLMRACSDVTDLDALHGLYDDEDGERFNIPLTTVES